MLELIYKQKLYEHILFAALNIPTSPILRPESIVLHENTVNHDMRFSPLSNEKSPLSKNHLAVKARNSSSCCHESRQAQGYSLVSLA